MIRDLGQMSQDETRKLSRDYSQLLKAWSQDWNWSANSLLRIHDREFPNGPVVRTPSFAAEGPGFIPDWEAKIPQATWPNKLIN